MKTYYAVLAIHSTLHVNGVEIELPNGQLFIPVFGTKKDANKFVKGTDYDIIELTPKKQTK